MVIMVMDGRGGGIGAAVIKALRESMEGDLEILALGTNSIATSRMMKSGANKGGTGENASIQTSQKVGVIMSPISIIMANAMMGEVTPAMATSISSSDARKVLIPLTQERIKIIGISGEPLPHLVNGVVAAIKEIKGHV
jgi:hypothetical protein